MYAVSCLNQITTTTSCFGPTSANTYASCNDQDDHHRPCPVENDIDIVSKSIVVYHRYYTHIDQIQQIKSSKTWFSDSDGASNFV